MPELHFVIRWPDGKTETCYSPSTAVRAHFEPGAHYPLPEFVARSRAALIAASNRVESVSGKPCVLALRQLARIEAAAKTYALNTTVIFEAFKE